MSVGEGEGSDVGGGQGGDVGGGRGSGRARRLFEALDLDANGTLTRAEVITALRTKGPTLAAAGVLPFWGVGDAEASSALFDAADQNGDKVLSLEEFSAVVDRRFGWN